MSVPAFRTLLALSAVLAGSLAWHLPSGKWGPSGGSARRAPGGVAVVAGPSGHTTPTAAATRPAPRAEADPVCDEEEDDHESAGRPRSGAVGVSLPPPGPPASRAGPAPAGAPGRTSRPRFLLCGRLTC